MEDVKMPLKYPRISPMGNLPPTPDSIEEGKIAYDELSETKPSPCKFLVAKGTLFKVKKEGEYFMREYAKAIFYYDGCDMLVCLLPEYVGIYPHMALDFKFEVFQEKSDDVKRFQLYRYFEDDEDLYLPSEWTEVTMNLECSVKHWVTRFTRIVKYYSSEYADRFIAYFTHMCTTTQRSGELSGISYKPVLEDQNRYILLGQMYNESSGSVTSVHFARVIAKHSKLHKNYKQWLSIMNTPVNALLGRTTYSHVVLKQVFKLAAIFGIAIDDDPEDETQVPFWDFLVFIRDHFKMGKSEKDEITWDVSKGNEIYFKIATGTWARGEIIYPIEFRIARTGEKIIVEKKDRWWFAKFKWRVLGGDEPVIFD